MTGSIIQSFDIWTDAQGIKSKGRVRSIENITHEGVARLRALILELAIRGKLVSQDPVDEPVSELIKKVAKEKGKLTNDKKSENDSEILVEPFELPQTWHWTLLDKISTITGGYAFKSSNYSTEGYRVIRISDFDEFSLKENDAVRHKFSSDLTPFLLKVNNILMAMTGGTVGKSLLVKEVKEPMIVNQRVATINILAPISPRYINYVIRTDLIQDVVQEAKNSTNDNISMADIKGFKIPLPPLAEQNRIVAKVEELMALCDKLENEQTKNLKTHQLLVKALLETLTQAKDAHELQEAWQRMSKYFDALFCTEDSIDQLKQTVLQLAIMGRLVKQDPDDEPASELIKRIEEEKTNLLKVKKSKKENSLPQITNKEHPFALPRNWEWVRLQQIIQISSGDGLTASQMNGSGNIPVFGGNGINGYHDRSNVTRPTLVIGRVGFYCGSIHITPGFAWVTDNAFITYFSEKNIDIHFLSWLLKGTNLKENDNATAQPVISGRKVYPIVIGLPPLPEQKRIVAKVDELMALCDQLKAQVKKSEEIKILLSKTIVEKAVA